jgi:hypothetical protein
MARSHDLGMRGEFAQACDEVEKVLISVGNYGGGDGAEC